LPGFGRCRTVRASMKTLSFALLAAAISVPLRAQTIDDGIMMTAGSLQAGNIYTRDAWDEYWEGTLKRTNGNIGTITTQTNSWTAVYGLTDRVSVMGSAPLVWTRPSQGVLAGQRGMQDVTIGGKYSFLERSSKTRGTLRAIVALSGSFPLTNYTPDFAPLSIGNQSQKISPRLTLNYQTENGLYANVSTSYARRADVMLDRPFYFTDNQFFLTSRVTMPDVVDYVASAGYLNHNLNASIAYSEQTTQGGGDIRRQDAPFVSNRQNFSRLAAMAMYPIPKFNRVAFQFSVAHVLDGRNVGQSTTYGFGFLYSHSAHGRLIR
jgi:outer membrane putative beta-barrel porin/alpha-amylase